MNSKGFLGTNASVLADLTLVLSLLVATLLTIGVGLAVRKRYTAHRWVQTVAVSLNALLVLLVMMRSFFKSAAPGIPEKLEQTYYLAALMHGLIGLVAFGFGSFVALRGNELVPQALKFNNYKRFMRIAYGLYMLASVLGVWVYLTWYRNAPVATPNAPTQANEIVVPMQNFGFNPVELVVPVGSTVVWVNNDSAPHSATADDGTAFDSGLLEGSQNFKFTFNTVGEFPYYCELHGSPGGVDMAGTIKVVPTDQAPPVGAVSVPATATPKATPLPLPTKPLGDPIGVAAFRDATAHNDQLVLEINLPSKPDANQQLVGFLTTSSGNNNQVLGPLVLDNATHGTLTFTAPDGANLFSQFNRVVISAEPLNATPSKPSGPILFAGELPAQSVIPLRELLVAGPLAPNTLGYAVGLDQQAQELARHANLVAEAHAKNDLAGVQRHAEHVFNLLAGSRDAQFGDLNGDGRKQNPGDGFGLVSNGDQRGYIGVTADSAIAAMNASDVTTAIKVHAGHVQICTANVETWSKQAHTLALEISKAKDLGSIANQVAELAQLGQMIAQGVDVNKDGFITPTAGECGARIAYEHSQYMAGFGLNAVKP